MMASGEAHRKKKVRVVIVGAGIAGLTAARMLAKEGIYVILIEGRDRAGGRIHTFDVSNGTTYSSGQPDEANYVDLGASFVHGHIGNPLSALQKQAGFRLATPKDDETSAIWYDRANGQKLTEEQSIKAGYFAHATVFEGLHRIAQDTDYMASEADNLWSALISKDEPFSQIWKGVVREEKAGIFSVLKMWTGWTGAMYANTALKWWGFEQEYVGKDLVVQPGYQSLVRWSVDEIAGQGGSIMLGEKVTEVRLDEDKRGIQIISTKAEYSADFVISSLPLGVMQHCPPDFTPALPVRRKQSIDSLGMGLLNKIVVTYDHAWWKKATSSPWFMVLPSRIATEAEGYQLPQEKVPQTIAEAQWLLLHNGLFFQDYTQLTGKNTLVCFLGPPSAHAQEMLDDEWVVNTVHERLARSILTLTEREMLSRPSASVVTRWGTDEFSRGSYSYFSAASRTSAGSGPADMLEQARPLWGGRLGFAGEHTSVNCFASVHGALLSGQREAKRVLSLIQLGQEGENDYEN